MRKMVASVMESQDTTRLYLTETQDSNFYILETTRRELSNLPEPAKYCMEGELTANEEEIEEESDPNLVKMKVQLYRHDELASILFKK